MPKKLERDVIEENFKKLLTNYPLDYVKKVIVPERIQNLAFPFKRPPTFKKVKPTVATDEKINELAKGLASHIKNISTLDYYAKAACFLGIHAWNNVLAKEKQFLDSASEKDKKILHLRIIAPLRGSYPLSLMIEEVFKRLAKDEKNQHPNKKIVVDVIHPILSKSLGTSDLDLKKERELKTPDRFIPHEEPYPSSKTVDVYVDEVISGATIRSTIKDFLDENKDLTILGFAAKTFQQYLQSPLSQLMQDATSVYAERIERKEKSDAELRALTAFYFLLDLVSNDKSSLLGWIRGKRPKIAKMPTIPGERDIAATKVEYRGKTDVFPIYVEEPRYGGELASAFVYVAHQKIRRFLPKIKQTLPIQTIS